MLRSYGIHAWRIMLRPVIVDGVMFAASNFEFKYRFWIIGAFFWVAFSAYTFDHQNAGAAIVERLSGGHAPDSRYHAIFWIGALFCILAAAIRTWGTAYLNPEVMVDMRLHTTRLVADGPYRYVRNPLYFGNVLLAIGFGFMASTIGMPILVVGILLFSYRLILREEAGILASQGDSYRAYCVAVPRLLPSLTPKLPSGGMKPNWGAGLLGEAFMWVMALSVAAFAVTLDQKIFFVVLASAFVVYAACYVVIKSREKTKADRQKAPAEGRPK